MADILKYRSWTDVVARVMGVGIFVIENYNHLANFDMEVSQLVQPAVNPLPVSAAKILHAVTITLGLSGSMSVRSQYVRSD